MSDESESWEPGAVEDPDLVFADRMWVAAGGAPSLGMTFGGVTLGLIDRINELEVVLAFALTQIAHINSALYRPEKQ